MRYSSPYLALFFVICVPLNELFAAPAIPCYQRFRESESIDQAELGRLLAGELNCLSCHSADDQVASAVHTKQAPNLMNIGARVKPTYLRRFIADPTGTKPGTTMPGLLHGLSENETSRQVEALVHYLVSLTGQSFSQDEALIGARRRGEKLYHEIGCVACHDAKGDGAVSLPHSVPQGELDAKYSLGGLAEFLQHPLETRPSGRMPSLNLSLREAQDIAAYLLPHVPERAGAAYSVYRGDWQRLPNFDELNPVRLGSAEGITASVGEMDRFGLRWDARFAVPKTGTYRFHLGADDGARLFVDGKMIIDNDGIHGVVWKNKRIQLGQGTHDLKVDYFEQAGGEELYLEVEGPGFERMTLDSLLVGTSDHAVEIQQLKPNSDLIKQGRELFHSIGCASCHDVAESVSPPPRTLVASLTDLQRNQGCLAEDPTSGIPDFDLSLSQRDSLADFMESANRDDVPAISIQSTMLMFNCYACHARDAMGGVESPRNKSFKTTQPEMGDEGRIPPPLDGVGAKLTTEWLDGILGSGAKDRPYMLTRMPKFGAVNVGHMCEQFEAQDVLPQLAAVEFDVVEGKKAAWHMVGNRGFGCIQCHTFGRYKATGVQSIDMTIMTKRLRENWFRSYVRNPQSFRKGTRMPSAWPQEESILPNLLGGSSSKQIAAIWNYLRDGRRAKTPLGLVTNSMELIAGDEAIIYRNFIEGAGSRAIGVGYPAGINLAFDANNMSIALIWQGAFIDAKRHWTGRGQGFEPPKGENVKRLGQAVSFASLPSTKAKWPTKGGRELGYQFRGYRLGKERQPTFFYSIDGTQISDTPSTIETATAVSLSRTIKINRIETKANLLYYRAAVAETIRDMGNGMYELGNQLNVSIKSTPVVKPIIRESIGQTELLIPIDADAVTIIQDYAW